MVKIKRSGNSVNFYDENEILLGWVTAFTYGCFFYINFEDVVVFLNSKPIPLGTHDLDTAIDIIRRVYD